ncbi:uncharacterized protein FOMMEDRAFT_119510 [Fomitiporia mediterranea MF3/22]|uniref:uncharacterized protein n=1 Tax=Fomitiporia mediterranea (strain MF3/22) TaxID=694068 RepID=UPI0004409C6C|nr:uncharacterized protein FOMMEDRAFT_119510 [Fomitiporia mediterranea MF3/22]EJD06034.1 hypothetical protein FOMMEDRAFT_119510 [Fomitiporia mediterranea MF3/22]
MRSASASLSLADSDSDDELDAVFSSDITFDLLGKLKDVLIVAKLKSWHIFEESIGVDAAGSDSAEKATPFRFRRSSFNAGGKRSRSFSPKRTKRPSSDLLSQCISTLSSITLEDCRYQIRSVRLSRPPNALQALSLDVWQLLVFMHKGNPRVLSDIGHAVIPAFSTFPASMHRRILTFFEDSLLRLMLYNLRSLQTGSLAASAIQINHDESDNGPDAPIVAIQVDEAQDSSFVGPTSFRDWQRWTPPNLTFQGVLASSAPAQSMEIYYLSSVVGPLLTAILDNVDLTTEDLTLSHRLQAFFCFLAEYKPDTPLELLQVVAYHSARSRQLAISLLLTFWPKAFGHLSISKPLPVHSHSETLQKTDPYRPRQSSIHPHYHQFVPWHFSPASSSVVFEGSSLHDCHVCVKQIRDFGLFCPFCMCAVHSNCYDSPDGSYLAHYPVFGEPSTQKVAVHRYSYVRPRRSGFDSDIVNKGHHAFRLVNVFTLSLCGACRRPLWGYIAQGYRCMACNQYVHQSCLHGDSFEHLPVCHSEPDSSRITINWTDLRSSFLDFYREVLLQEQDILHCTFEEVAIFWTLLWTQLQLLKYGIASGSIIVKRDRSSTADTQAGVDNFELQHLEKLYHAYLLSDRLRSSVVVQDLLQRNGYSRQFPFFLFDWPTLLFITSLIKSPLSEEDEVVDDFLRVTAMSGEDNLPGDSDMHPAEVVSVAHIRDVLGGSFGLQKVQAACIMLGHLRHIGFFDSMDLPEGFFTSCDRPSELLCSFSLPLGLDISANVEFLIVAVESCLEDLDISVNESGFLLLTRKLWPNGMASDYAIARLMRAVLSWVLSEDDNLVIILREYIAKNKSLPGVPSAAENHAWPNNNPSRSTSSGSVNNGGDYVACRKSLLDKYATRWMFAIHCQDPDTYAQLLFDTISGIAMDSAWLNHELDSANLSHGDKGELPLCADKVLRSIMKISQTTIAFSVIDDLFLKWLTVFPSTLPSYKPLPTLPRLFNRDVEGTARWTSAFDATVTSFEHVNAPLLEPWRVVTDVAARDYDGLKKGLDWLCIFASSGVDIPVNTFLQISALARDLNAPFDDHMKLAEAVFMSIWIKSLGRLDLQRLISDLHDRFVNYILARLERDSMNDQLDRFFRLTLSSFLLLYGCDRPRLQELGLVKEIDIEGLSRRKAIKRASFSTEPALEDIDFVEILARYVEEGTDELRCLIAKSLTCFVTESSLLSMQELEAIILRNSFFLTRCAWKVYDMQIPEVNDFRSTLLLRVLVVDARHFEELLREHFGKDDHWETQLSTATKLFQIILDVAKPSFTVEGRQWRSSVMEIFYRFFSCLWSSEHEEIRLAVDAWVQTLQPVHQQAITLCFSEYLSHAPISDRLELVSFLLQLRSHFPTWKVLTWDVVIETLMDDEFLQRTDADETGISAHLAMYGITSSQKTETTQNRDPDASMLQASLLLLSLQMIADGVSIDIFSYLKIKMQLVALFGFSEASLVPAPSGHSFHVQFGELKALNSSALPCIQGLMTLLDAYRLYDVAPSAMIASGAEDDTTYPVLVGSIVVDVFLGVFQYMLESFSDFPYPQAKMMLQSFIIVIYKHDVEAIPLRHLRESVRRTVKRVSYLLSQEIGSDLKQLVLTALQAYRRRWLNYASSRDLLVHQVTDVIQFIAASTTTKDDYLVGQTISLLEDIFTMHSGTFYNLSKQSLTPEMFSVLRLVMARNARNVDAQALLPDILLRDTLQFMVAMQNEPGRKNIIENFRKYIENVHFQGFSSDSLSHFGESIVAILRNASELSDEAFDPNPLLLAAATLIQYNKAQVRGLLPHLENAVRISLVRFDIHEQSLRRLLQVTSALYRRTASEPGASAQDRNVILAVVVDILSEGLRGKCRVTPTTLKTMVESLCKPGLNYLSSGSLSRLGADALFFLQNLSFSDIQSLYGIQASRSASTVILRAGSVDRGLLYRYLGDNASERSNRHTLTVRAWNALVLEALQSSPEWKPAAQLFDNLSSFSASYHSSLRAQIQGFGLPPDLTASDVNQAYVAIKLWLLLSRTCSEEARITNDGMPSAADHMLEDRNASLVWNELWPPFERLVNLLESDTEVGDVMPIANLVWSSVADIFLFLRSMRSTISLESTSHVATLNRVKALAKGESFANKFARSLKSISEPPPEVPIALLIAQVTQELVAAEKLNALESRRELGRMLPDKSKRDIRTPNG